MKKYHLLILLLLGLLSCEKVDTVINTQTPRYIGTMEVFHESVWNTSENVEVQVAWSEPGVSLDIKMLKVKFVPAMPVRLDVIIPKVPVTLNSDGSYRISGDGIIPHAMGAPFTKFTVTELKGRLSESELEYSLNFGIHPTRYSGKKSGSEN